MKISIFCTPLNCPFLIVRSACWADRDQQTRRDLPPAAHHLSIQIKSRLWLTFTNTPIFRIVLCFLLKNKCKKFDSNQFLTVFKPVDQLLSILSVTIEFPCEVPPSSPVKRKNNRAYFLYSNNMVGVVGRHPSSVTIEFPRAVPSLVWAWPNENPIKKQ